MQAGGLLFRDGLQAAVLLDRGSTGAPVITTTALPNGANGVAYSVALATTGTLPITYSVIAGTAPPWLTVGSSTGLLTGTAATGTWTFTIRAANAGGNGDKAFTLLVPNSMQASGTLQDVSAELVSGAATEGADTATAEASSVTVVLAAGTEGDDTGTATANYTGGTEALSIEGEDSASATASYSMVVDSAAASEGEDTGAIQATGLEAGVDLIVAVAAEGEDTAAVDATAVVAVTADGSEGGDTATAEVVILTPTDVVVAAVEGGDTGDAFIALNGWEPPAYFSINVSAVLDEFDPMASMDEISAAAGNVVLDDILVTATV